MRSTSSSHHKVSQKACSAAEAQAACTGDGCSISLVCELFAFGVARILSPAKSSLTLYLAHRDELLNYAITIVRDRASAEDLLQEAWVRFHEAADTQVLKEPLAYLYRIVRNLAVDGRRKLGRESLVIANGFEVMADAALDERPSVETELAYKQEYALVMQAIAELPERTRIAVEMHRFGGRKLREIAARLGISVPLAHVLVSEGIQHCKRRLRWP